MDCLEFEAHLEAWLEGEVPAAVRRECERHLGLCPACRRLAELAELSGAPAVGAPAEPPPDLLAAVLAGTGRSPCGRAEALLAQGVDEEPSATDRDLLELHLAGCGECRGLARTLDALAAELPRLAELQPGGDFVGAVLAATLPAGVRIRRRAAAALSRWVWRPRFASEVAFVATLVLVLVVAFPGSPLAAARGGVPDIGSVQAAIRLDEPVKTLERRMGTGVRALWQASGSAAASRVRSAAGLAGRGSHELFAAAREAMETFWNRAASLLVKSDEPAASGPNEPTEETP